MCRQGAYVSKPFPATEIGGNEENDIQLGIFK